MVEKFLDKTEDSNNTECMVSVICITYNQCDYIKKCIDGLLVQKTNFKYEIIIHDDVSTDGTIDILKNYEKNNPEKITVIYEKENQWSKGVDFCVDIIKNIAKGKYIALCEGDDYWIDENKLQLQYDAMENHTECDMCACRADMISFDGKQLLGEIRPQNKDGILTIENVIRGGGNYVATASLFYRRGIIYNFMEFQKVRGLDYATQMRGALRGGIYYLDRTMAVYRRYSAGSVTSNITSNGSEMNIQCEQEKEILRILDRETEGKYHSTIEERLGDYEISCFEQLMQNKEKILDEMSIYSGKIFIWGMGVRGRELERFCNELEIKIDGVCDILNNNLGKKTKYGNTICSTDEVINSSGIVFASVNGAYYYLKKNNYGNVINMQKYMTRM